MDTRSPNPELDEEGRPRARPGRHPQKGYLKMRVSKEILPQFSSPQPISWAYVFRSDFPLQFCCTHHRRRLLRRRHWSGGCPAGMQTSFFLGCGVLKETYARSTRPARVARGAGQTQFTTDDDYNFIAGNQAFFSLRAVAEP